VKSQENNLPNKIRNLQEIIINTQMVETRAETLKECGNTEFKNQNYSSAIRFFTDAI